MIPSWTKDAPICEECKCQHAVISYKCPFKIEKDAKVVLDASGAAFTWNMLDRLINDLQAKLPPSERSEMRLVSANPQAAIYCGLKWTKDEKLSPDMIICETGRVHGVLKRFEVTTPPAL